MTQCSCPFRQRNQVLVFSLGQELGSLNQKSRYISDFEWNNVFVPRHKVPQQLLQEVSNGLYLYFELIIMFVQFGSVITAYATSILFKILISFQINKNAVTAGSSTAHVNMTNKRKNVLPYHGMFTTTR